MPTIDQRPRKVVQNREFIQYDDYWIRFYTPPNDSYREKLELIDALTRRTFHHSEPGINTPGSRLESARQNYEEQQDPDKRRVNAAMLAGALFNRATDIFHAVVEMESKGIKIDRKNELLKQCGACFKEALDLGQFVRHVSGDEGVDELWGEPLKVFTMPMKDYYESRYVKIAQAMRTIDEVSHTMVDIFLPLPWFDSIDQEILHFADVSKRFTEIMKSDPDFFAIWPEYSVARDRLMARIPVALDLEADSTDSNFRKASRLLQAGVTLINHVSSVRVPMRKSTISYLETLNSFQTSISQPLERIAQ
jgi:hypothetical protein